MPADTLSLEPRRAEDVRPQTLGDLQERHAQKQLLRFLTCGSVDDGKSTLIGRLLLEAGAVYDDQLAGLRDESAKHGTCGAEIDAALLVDGLEDERQQGITIDVAYRYFTTPRRQFIIADAPGHAQFTRNMATGASNSDLAVIVVDASKGVLTQTRRHAFIVSLLGIKQVILAVNKMDLVDFSEARFQQIRNEFCAIADTLEISAIRCVPVSALRGDNVARPSEHTPWYADGPLLELLESAPVVLDPGAERLRFPVQWVNRPHADFRGFCGTIAAGEVQVGDEVVVLPSGQKSRVRSIVTMDGELPAAAAPAAVTITLADEIDVARGDMIARPESAPRVVREAEAALVWMSEQPLTVGKQYWCKHTSRKTACEVSALRFAIDVNTQRETAAAALKLNDLGVCRVAFHDPLVVDDFAQNRATGSFILVDRVTHETVAAGMIHRSATTGAADHWDDEPPSRRLERATSLVNAEQRVAHFGHRPCTVLITGLSGAGKTSVALALEQQLFRRGCAGVMLDGQMMRFGISRDLGFSAAERSENVRRAAEIAKIVNDAGQICIAAFVAPEDAVRRRLRTLIGTERLVHVHLATPLEVCRNRDQSGRYAAADSGEIASFPGVTHQYEEPTDADLVDSTVDRPADAVAGDIVSFLVARGILAG